MVKGESEWLFYKKIPYVIYINNKIIKKKKTRMLKRWFEYMKLIFSHISTVEKGIQRLKIEPDPCPPKLPGHLQQNHFVEKTLWQCDIRFSSQRLAGRNQMQEYTLLNKFSYNTKSPSPIFFPQRKKQGKGTQNSLWTIRCQFFHVQRQL